MLIEVIMDTANPPEIEHKTWSIWQHKQFKPFVGQISHGLVMDYDVYRTVTTSEKQQPRTVISRLMPRTVDLVVHNPSPIRNFGI
jgi:hypothetical protein